MKILGLDIDIKSISQFNVIQADGPEEYSQTIVDEKSFVKLNDALKLIQESQAPVKYLFFYNSGSLYKLYPIEDSEEFQVTRVPVIN